MVERARITLVDLVDVNVIGLSSHHGAQSALNSGVGRVVIIDGHGVCV